jgi:hypothetical protein
VLERSPELNRQAAVSDDHKSDHLALPKLFRVRIVRALSRFGVAPLNPHDVKTIPVRS